MSEHETQNVTPLFPQQETEKPAPRHPLRKLILKAVLLVLAVAAICLWVFREQLSSSALRQFFARLGAGEGSAEVTFSFDEGSKNAYASTDAGFAAVTPGGFLLFHAQDGTLQASALHTYETPLLRASGAYAMACDIGENRLTLLNTAGKTLLDLETEGTILDADLAQDGSVCYAQLQKGYKTVLTVYDGKQNQIYRWYSSSRYLNQCAVSPGADALCAVALDGSAQGFESKALLFETDRQEPVAELSLGSQMIWQLQFLNAQTICAVGENGVQYFNRNGELLGSYDCEGQYLKDAALEGNGFILLSLNKYQAGSQYSVATVDDRGALLAEQYLGEEILSISAAGKYCAVLTASNLYLYDEKLNLLSSEREQYAASAAIMREDGSVILVGGGVGTLRTFF